MPEPLFKPTKVRSFRIEPFGVDGIRIHVTDSEDWIELTCRPEAIVERDREIEKLRAQYAALFKYADCRACKNRVWDRTCERYLCGKDRCQNPQGCPDFELKEVDT